MLDVNQALLPNGRSYVVTASATLTLASGNLVWSGSAANDLTDSFGGNGVVYSAKDLLKRLFEEYCTAEYTALKAQRKAEKQALKERQRAEKKAAKANP